MNKIVVLFVALCYNINMAAQTKAIGLEEAIIIALQNNKGLKSASFQMQATEQLKNAAYDIPKTNIDADYGQFNSKVNDTRIGISQSFAFPTVYSRQKKVNAESYEVAKFKYISANQQIKSSVRDVFYTYQLLLRKHELLIYADSIYGLLEEKANLRFKVGETNILEKSAAEAARQVYGNQLAMVNIDMERTLESFNILLQADEPFMPIKSELKNAFLIDVVDNGNDSNPDLKIAEHLASSAEWQWKVERAKMLPDITIGYNNLSIIGSQSNLEGKEIYYTGNERFNFVNVGISIPLFYTGQSAKIRASKLEFEALKMESENVKAQLKSGISNARKLVEKYGQSLSYYEKQGLKSASIIIDTANSQLYNGDIDYLQWVMVVNQAITIKSDYLDRLAEYNAALINFQKITNL